MSRGRAVGRWFHLLAGLLMLLALAPAPARADGLAEARDLLRSRSADDRRKAVRRLLGLDCGAAVRPLEDALRRSLQSIEKMAKDVDKADKALGEELSLLRYAERYEPDLVGPLLVSVRRLQAEWDDLALEMLKHLLVCKEVGDALPRFNANSAIRLVEEGARSEHEPFMRQLYVRALGRAQRRRSIPVLLGLLDERDGRIRAMAARSLRPFMLDSRVVAAMDVAAQDPHWAVRLAAYENMGRAPFEQAVPFLVRAALAEDGRMAAVANDLLASLTGEDFSQTPRAWEGWWARNEQAVREGTWTRPAAPRVRGAAAPTVSTFFRIPVRSRNLLLAIDTSASMTEDYEITDPRVNETREELKQPATRLGYAKTEAVRAIRALPDGALFNVLVYGSEAETLATRPLKSSASTRHRAERWILKEKTRGMTNIWDALRVCFGDHLDGSGGRQRFDVLPDTILFLTDGAATRGRFQTTASLTLLAQIWNRAPGAEIDCVGIGEDHDHELLRALAKETQGFYMDLSKGASEPESFAAGVPESERRPHLGRTLAACATALEGGSRRERLEAARALARLGTFAAPLAPKLAALLDDSFDEVSAAAADALVPLGPVGVPFIARQLARDDDVTRAVTLKTLARIGPDAEAAVPAVLELALAAGSAVQLDALATLAAIGPRAQSAAEALEPLLQAADPAVAEAARRALEEIREG